MQSDRKHDRERIECPRFLLFGLGDRYLARPDRKNGMRGKMRVNNGFVFVISAGVIRLVDVLGRRKQKRLKHGQTELNGEHGPHSGSLYRFRRE